MNKRTLIKDIYDFFIKFISTDEYKKLRIIYLIAFISSIIIFTLGPQEDGGDTISYYYAAKKIITGSFDFMRTPLYPIFLIITLNSRFTIILQYLIFFVSITYLYKTLETVKISPRLIFITMIIYVCHPVFIYYQNQRIPEALCISLCSIFVYYSVKFIKNEKTLDCWMSHLIILFMILLKPGCIFLLSVPVILLLYLFFVKRKLILSHIIPSLFVFIIIGSYAFSLKKTYDVFSISSVSDINLYWMLRERDQVNVNLIEDDDVKNYVSGKINIKYEKFVNYIYEGYEIINKYGWKELHTIVQGSLKENYKSFYWSKSNIETIRKNLYGYVGKSFELFTPRNKILDNFSNSSLFLFNFYQLILILFFYFILIVIQIYKTRNIPIISILFLSCILIHIFTLIMTAPNNYGRLIVASLPIILIVCTQCFERIVLFIRKDENKFELV